MECLYYNGICPNDIATESTVVMNRKKMLKEIYDPMEYLLGFFLTIVTRFIALCMQAAITNFGTPSRLLLASNKDH